MIGSQNSASFGRSVLCLPLIKFSFATVNPDMSSIPWEHRHSKDMFVLIEHDTGTGRPALQLRVIEASNTVETIPLSKLANAALKIKEAHESTSGPLKKIHNLPIFAMVKANAIAIRYNTMEEKSRRTQMNFSNDDDRQELQRKLAEIGIVVTDPPSKDKGSTLPSSHLPPSSAFGSTLNRPHTSDALRVVPYSSSLCSATPPPMTAPSSLAPDLRSQSNPYASSSTLGNSPEPTRPHGFTSYEHYASSKQGERPRIDTGELHPSRMDVTEALDVPAQSLNYRPASATSTKRDQSADIPSDPPLTIQDIMPPRRHLPFAKPSSRDSIGVPKLRVVDPSSSPSGSERETYATKFKEQRAQLPRLGMPSPPEILQRPDGTSSLGQRGGTSSTLVYENMGGSERPNVISSDPMPSPNRSSRLEPSDLYANAFLSSSSQLRPSSPLPRSSSPPPKSSSPLPGSSSTAPVPRSPGRNGQPTLGRHSPSTAKEFDRVVNNPLFQASLGSNGVSSDRQMLASYAAQSREQRADVLNSLLVGYLDDPDFHDLCNDIEGAWRWGVLGERGRPGRERGSDD